MFRHPLPVGGLTRSTLPRLPGVANPAGPGHTQHMTRFGLLASLALLGCDPAPSTTDSDTEGTSETSGSPTGTPTSTDTSTGGAATSGTTTGEPDEESTGEDESDTYATCTAVTPAFCAHLTVVCVSAGLDVAVGEGSTICGAYADWCLEGRYSNTCDACSWLVTTCDWAHSAAPSSPNIPGTCETVYAECIG